jgi:GAF domain-containing protein
LTLVLISRTRCLALSISPHDSSQPSLNRPGRMDRGADRVFGPTVSDVAQTLFSASSVRATLTAVVDIAVTTIEGCDFAGLSIAENGVVITKASTDPLVGLIDSLQRQTGEGPGVDAITHQLTFHASDLGHDLRWRHFSPQAAKTGIRSDLVVPLSVGAQRGTLNLLAHAPAAFSAADRADAATLASLAGIAISVAHAQEEEARRVANYDAALASRAEIGEALGILMERHRITAEQALDALRHTSQKLNIKLREVAYELITTGEVPEVLQRAVTVTTS